MAANNPNIGDRSNALDVDRFLPTAFLSADECEALANDVASCIRPYNPVQLLTGLAFQNLLVHPTDAHPAFVEYLHHLILATPPVPDPSDVSEEFLETVFTDVKNIYGGVILGRSQQGDANDQRGGLRDALVRDTLLIRGKSYFIHKFSLLERLLGGIDDWLREHMDIEADDILRTAHHLIEVVQAKASGTLTEKRRRDSLRMAVECDFFRLSPADEPVERILKILSASPGSQPPPTSFLPGKAWPSSRDYPILSYQGAYYCFNAQQVLEDLPGIVSGWIANRDQAFIDRRYAKFRERLLTEMTIEALIKVLPGAEHGQNLYYPITGSEQAETDGIVIYDDIVIVIEAKAGALTFPARQGKPKRMEKDFKSLVGKAFFQAQRVAIFITDNPRGHFTDRHGRTILSLDNKRIRKVYFVNPVLDSMDAFAIELADARNRGLLAPDAEWPWCVFINDLRVVTEILDTPPLFILYMDRRLRFNAHSSWFHVHDEIDLFDNFLHTGLFLETKPVQGADTVLWQAESSRLDQYFAAKARGIEPPPKPRPPYLSEIMTLVQGLDGSGVPGRTALLAEIMAMGEVTHRKILDALSDLQLRVAQRRKPQVASFVSKGVGLSVWYTERWNPSLRHHLLLDDACRKYEHKADQWLSAIFLCENEQPALVEVVRDVSPWRADAEMQAAVQMARDAKYEARAHNVSVGRNDPCPCGSGKKFKKCHGR